MRKYFATTVGMGLLLGLMLAPALGQEGFGERLGEKLDRGLKQLRSELREGWAEVRQSVERMGVQGRVYSRLHWDKALENAAIKIEVRDTDVVVLHGSVPDATAKQKAAQLAGDTVGVNSVIDELTVAEPVAAPNP